MQERQTRQKQAIYEALTALDHPTATEVYGYVKQSQPTVSRATVFRVLGGFATSGRALELRLAGNEVRYDYRLHPHYHARCVHCGRVVDVETDTPPIATEKVEAMCGFSVEGYSVEYFGTCAACKAQNS